MKKNKKNQELTNEEVERAVITGSCFAVVIALAFSIFGFILLSVFSLILQVFSLGAMKETSFLIFLVTTPMGWALLITLLSSLLVIVISVRNSVKGDDTMEHKWSEFSLSFKQLFDDEEKTESANKSELTNRQLFDKFAIIAICTFVICLLVYYLVF